MKLLKIALLLLPLLSIACANQKDVCQQDGALCDEVHKDTQDLNTISNDITALTKIAVQDTNAISGLYYEINQLQQSGGSSDSLNSLYSQVAALQSELNSVVQQLQALQAKVP